MPIFGLTESKSLPACFLLGFLVRLIPEVLAYPHPVGFDTVDYAFVMENGVVWPHWSTFFTSSWLFHAVSVSLYRVLGGNPFALLKVLAPVLFGLNVAGVFWFAKKMLGWSVRLCFFAGVFFAFQLASLRISWDLLRNTLGLGVLLFALPFIKSLNTKEGFACFVLLSLLSVFAHEYAAVCLFFIVLGLVLQSLLKREGFTKNKRLLLAVSPSLIVFLAGLYLRFYPIRYGVESNVLSVGDEVYASVGGLFFLTDYLNVKTSVDWYLSYADLFFSVFALSAVYAWTFYQIPIWLLVLAI